MDKVRTVVLIKTVLEAFRSFIEFQLRLLASSQDKRRKIKFQVSVEYLSFEYLKNLKTNLLSYRKDKELIQILLLFSGNNFNSIFKLATTFKILLYQLILNVSDTADVVTCKSRAADFWTRCKTIWLWYTLNLKYKKKKIQCSPSLISDFVICGLDNVIIPNANGIEQE